MKVQVLDGSLVLKHKLKSGETYKVDQRKRIFTLSVYSKPQWVSGLTSRCADGKEILFLDFDNTLQWVVEHDLVLLAEKVSPFYLFYTKREKKDGEWYGNFHAISISKCFPFEVVAYQKETHGDPAYMTMPLRSRYRSWVLRMSDKKGSNKPTFLKIIGTKHLDKETSRAHLIALEALYHIPKVPYTNLDNNKRVWWNKYETG